MPHSATLSTEACSHIRSRVSCRAHLNSCPLYCKDKDRLRNFAGQADCSHHASHRIVTGRRYSGIMNSRQACVTPPR